MDPYMIKWLLLLAVVLVWTAAYWEYLGKPIANTLYYALAVAWYSVLIAFWWSLEKPVALWERITERDDRPD